MSEDAPIAHIPTPPHIPHYHGDAVRILFVIAAGMVFLIEMLDAELPFSPALMMTLVVLLVIAAGITNPVQKWIHWVNLLLSVIGLMLFGGTALARFKTDAPFHEYFLITSLATVFLVALYLATRTVRGYIVHGRSPHGRTDEG